MPNTFKSISEVFNSEPGLKNVRDLIKKTDVINEFFEIIPGLEKFIVPVKVTKKTLYLHVENSTWRNELKLNEELIINKINNHFKEERILQVRFI